MPCVCVCVCARARARAQCMGARLARFIAGAHELSTHQAERESKSARFQLACPHATFPLPGARERERGREREREGERERERKREKERERVSERVGGR